MRQQYIKRLYINSFFLSFTKKMRNWPFNFLIALPFSVLVRETQKTPARIAVKSGSLVEHLSCLWYRCIYRG